MKNKILAIGTFSVAFFLPFGTKISKYTLLIFIASFIYYYVKNYRSKEIKTNAEYRKNDLVIFIPPILFLCYCISLTYTSNLSEGLKYIERKLSLLLFPLFFAFIKMENRTEVVKSALNGFVYGCLIISIMCLARAFFRALSWEDNVGMSFDASVLKGKGFGFYESITQGGNYFFSSELSHFLHPAYFAIYLVFGIGIIYYFGLFRRQIRLLAISLLIFVIYLLSSRGGYLSLFILTMFLTIELMEKSKVNHMLKMIIGSCIIAFSVIILSFNPRAKALLTKIISSKLEIEKNGQYSDEIHLMVWDASLGIIKKNPFLGVGIGDVDIVRNSMYEKLGYIVPRKKTYNSHNQFLEIYVSCGIIGFILLLIAFAFPLFVSRDKLFRLFLIILFVQFLFESMLNRYEGVVFFSFFYSLLSLNMKKKVILNEKIITNEDLSSGK